jgi:hypothetical protein
LINPATVSFENLIRFDVRKAVDSLICMFPPPGREGTRVERPNLDFAREHTLVETWMIPVKSQARLAKSSLFGKIERGLFLNINLVVAGIRAFVKLERSAPFDSVESYERKKKCPVTKGRPTKMHNDLQQQAQTSVTARVRWSLSSGVGG